MSVEVNMYIAIVMRLGLSQICQPCSVSIYLYNNVMWRKKILKNKTRKCQDLFSPQADIQNSSL